MSSVAWVVFAFAAGTLPSAFLVAWVLRRHDVIADMRRTESPGDAHFLLGNRVGKSAAVVAIVADIMKGFVPALLAVRAQPGVATVALVGVAAVAGHTFAPFLRSAGGRGLSAAAGVSLVVVPKAMVATGVIALAGTVTKRGGLGTSIGFGLMPVFALAFGYPAASVWMTCGIVIVIAARRLEGVDGDRRAGVPMARAVLGRLLFDAPRGGGTVRRPPR